MSEQTRLDEMRDQVSAFHNKHPEVWDLFVKFSFEMITNEFNNTFFNCIWVCSK